MHLSTTPVIALSFLMCAAPACCGAMVHPGGWHTETDLERIRTKVAAGLDPWKSAWAALQGHDAEIDYKARVKPNIEDAYAIQRDGHAAYVLAIKWVASGDIKYARASMKIIDDWTSTVQSDGQRRGDSVSWLRRFGRLARRGRSQMSKLVQDRHLSARQRWRVGKLGNQRAGRDHLNVGLLR
jgi:hypothetical protein